MTLGAIRTRPPPRDFGGRLSTAVIEYGVVLPDSKSLDLHLPGFTFSFLAHCKTDFQEDHVLNSSHQERRARASPSVSIGFVAHLLLVSRPRQSSGSVYSKTAI